MKTRIIVGAILTALLVAMLIFGGYVLLVTLTIFSVAATYEMSLLLKKKEIDPILPPVYAFMATYAFVYFYFGATAMLMLCAAAILAVMIVAVCSVKHTMLDAVGTLFLFAYPAMPLMCLMLTYLAIPAPMTLTAACLAYAAPEFSDTMAYFGGTLFGKRKLCPSISPKKTVAGSVAAFLGGGVFGAILIPLQQLWGGGGSPILLICVGLGCGVLSQFGDLFASKLKRWAEIKDFSSVFPGHGGIMDRIDSMLFCGPFVLAVFSILESIHIY